MDDAQLQTIWQQRQRPLRATALAAPLGMLMKRTLGKRVKQLGALSEAWDELLPEGLQDHTAMETFARGVLTVMVDSAAHRFQLQTLLEGGLLKESGPAARRRSIRSASCRGSSTAPTSKPASGGTAGTRGVWSGGKGLLEILTRESHNLCAATGERR